MAEYTPLMQQYLEIKKNYKDCILFYRLGDFYEMFFEDAITASSVLEITLTGRNCGLEERAPMCGIPYHAVDTYLSKLVENGYKVAICEQMEDPKLAKGLVKRDITRIVTPGTNIITQSLDETKNNYIMCIVYVDSLFGIATSDISTGDFYVTEVDSNKKLNDEINRFNPSEIICNDSFNISGYNFDDLKMRFNITPYALEPHYFDDFKCSETLKEHFNTKNTNSLGLMDYPIGMISSGALLMYLYETQKNSLSQLNTITPYTTSEYMMLDSSTRRNLELSQTINNKTKRGSLLWVLDKTKTAMGARMLRNYVEQPLIDADRINARLDAIEQINTSMITREEIREYLGPVYDLERILTKISYNTANPRDLLALRNSLEMLPPIKTLLGDFECDLIKELNSQMDSLSDIFKLIDDSITDEPPLAVKEGGIIKDGFNEEVDRLRLAKTEGKNWLAAEEAKEKENTGIKNLKIKYNKVFGYYLEVTNSYKDLVPDDWIRKQTTTNSERYITPKLKELENTILGSQDRLYSLEYELFNDIREKTAAHIKRIQATAKSIAAIDALCSLAYVAQQNNYVRPHINCDGKINIKDGRHPVVEKMIDNGMFISNDTVLDNEDKRLSIITGPNMAGKSTYMRQTALIVLMAQIGSFVPASSADIGIVDRIFTRVGASDDLSAGQSTFMVEMSEVSNILKNATSKSLLILDEIGRGTSTFDGLAIAWAVVEYISNKKILGAKTLFATHYHELTELEGKIDGVKNLCIAVKENGEDIIFLRKIVQGGADKSYGIQVARLAGVPKSVLTRANELVAELSNNDISDKIKIISETGSNIDESTPNETNRHEFAPDEQLGFDFLSPVTTNSVLDEIKNLNLNKLTPFEALNLLYKYQDEINNNAN